jgi:hypothetical protein
MTPRAESVTVDGEPDGFEPPLAWAPERTPHGDTRLVVSAPPAELPRVHQALIRALKAPLGLLYRQKVDRQNPRPQTAPPVDYLALELPCERVIEAMAACEGVVYGDARAELWVKGDLGEQLVLDQDGLLYLYPDDPSFRDALEQAGVPNSEAQTLAERDYVKHWYHGEHDEQEAELIARLQLTRVRTQR